MTGDSLSIVVVGSVNLDLVAMAPRLPVAGETVTGATFDCFPGGKGANQALAAQRLGVNVKLIARVGKDAYADQALDLLRDGGVDLSACTTDPEAATGIGMIAVAHSGENQIVVAPGANGTMVAAELDMPQADALICQLEVPLDVLSRAAAEFSQFFCINLAPAMPVPESLLERADLVVVNDTEAQFYGPQLTERRGLVAVTHGADGAELYADGQLVAHAKPPLVTAVDTTGAGDTFTAALTVALLEQQDPQAALEFACAAAAASVTKAGAQPSLPTRREVEALLANGAVR